MLSREARDLAADVAHLLRGEPTFGGVHVSEYQGRERLWAVVEDDRARVRASARLSPVPEAAGVEIVSSRSVRGERLALTDEELALAAARDTERRARWAPAPAQIESHVAKLPRARAVFVVSVNAAEHARILRERSSIPLTTFGTTDATRALDVLAIHPPPDVVVLDRDLEGTTDVGRALGGLYPSRLDDPSRIQFFSSTEGLGESSLAQVLGALGAVPLTAAELSLPFARLRIGVLATEEAGLAEEIAASAPGADIIRSQEATWRACRDGQIDLLVIGLHGSDLDASVNAIPRRFRMVPAMLVVALEDDAAHPILEGFELPVVRRPVTADVLRRALGLD